MKLSAILRARIPAARIVPESREQTRARIAAKRARNLAKTGPRWAPESVDGIATLRPRARVLCDSADLPPDACRNGALILRGRFA